jgi:hypothetical protein
MRTLSVILYGAFIATSLLSLDASAQTKRVEVSDVQRLGVQPANPPLQLPCGSIVQNTAKQFCSVNTPQGVQEGSFTLNPISQVSGGHCGITIYEIVCK